MVTPHPVDGYLARLGLSGLAHEAPSLEGLRLLHRRHVERIAYESIDVYRGCPPSIEPRRTAERFAAGRGGYCFHLAAGFSLLLTRLGYDARSHAGVVCRAETVRDDPVNHHALTVVGLDDVPWLADVGLGDALYEPLPLRPGVFRQGPFTYRLRRSWSSLGAGWWFEHSPGMAFGGFHFGDAAVAAGAFDGPHVNAGSLPTSGFVRLLSVHRRLADRAESLRGCLLRVTDATGVRDREIETFEQWWTLLTDGFGLDFDMAQDDRSALWQRVRREHEEWDAAGRPGWKPAPIQG